MWEVGVRNGGSERKNRPGPQKKKSVNFWEFVWFGWFVWGEASGGEPRGETKKRLQLFLKNVEGGECRSFGSL